MSGVEDHPEILERYLIGEFEIEIHREGDDEHVTLVKIGRQALYDKLLRKSQKLSPQDLAKINREVESGTIPRECGLVVNGIPLPRSHLEICSRHREGVGSKNSNSRRERSGSKMSEKVKFLEDGSPASVGNGIDVTDYIKPTTQKSRLDGFNLNEIAPSEVVEDPRGREILIEQAGTWLGRSSSGIHASDLQFMKKAYWQKKRPEIKPTEREVGYYLAGKGHHGIIQYVTTLPDYREVSVNYEGVKGHVDMVHGVPIELKTTRAYRVRSPRELERKQPHYFSRLGIYCAMTDSHDGEWWLFYLNAQVSKNERQPLIKIYDVHYDDLDAIREEIVRRKELLERALDEDDPTVLPDCPEWMCSNCRYRELCKEGEGQ